LGGILYARTRAREYNKRKRFFSFLRIILENIGNNPQKIGEFYGKRENMQNFQKKLKIFEKSLLKCLTRGLQV